MSSQQTTLEKGELLFTRGSCRSLRIRSHWTAVDPAPILNVHSGQGASVSKVSSAPPESQELRVNLRKIRELLSKEVGLETIVIPST